jgi:hypothetical protein
MTFEKDTVADLLVAEARRQLGESISRIKHCLRQVDEQQLWWRPSPTHNSIANLLLHLCGNLRQRLVSLLGGAPDIRHRQQEFDERGPISKAELLRRLDDVVNAADQSMARLTVLQLTERRNYPGANRQFDDSVVGVLLRTLMHLNGHVQEIVCLTRLQLGDKYEFQGPP